jgi:acetyl esterase/lipase
MRVRPVLAVLTGLACALGAPVMIAAQSGATLLDGRHEQPPDLGLPELPKLMALSPRTTLLYADRDEVRPALGDYPPGTEPGAASAGVLLDGWIPASVTGTGLGEAFQYQVPPDYLPKGPARPMLIAWHGFGTSCKSVALQTTLDEQCASWGWIYLSVTGVDDKLFGPPVAQHNAETAIDWMLDHFNVDRDRIYMVGFSMGAGVVANFAARHRDPDGLMIAGVGLVSASLDWTMTWHGDSAVQVWLNNPWNFGGPPATYPFRYQRSSDLHFDPASYPPAPGVSLDTLAMAQNLHATPAYITWDTGDTLAYLPPQSEQLGAHLADWGAPVTLRPKAGTVNPSTGAPAPHSWAVLDEEELFNVLAPLAVQRVPGSFEALLERDTTVAFASVTQRVPEAFTWISGSTDAAGARVEVHGVVNAREVAVSATQAGLAGVWPLRVQASSADAEGFVLRITGCDTPPGYLLQAQGGALVPGVESDPATDSLLLTVPAGASVDVLAMSVPWTAGLSLLPDPASAGSGVHLQLTSHPGAQLAWVVVAPGVGGTGQQLMTLPGPLTFSVPPFPPALLLAVPLDATGAAGLDAQLPDNPGLAGLSLVLQAVIQDPGPVLADASNAFRFDIQ